MGQTEDARIPDPGGTLNACLVTTNTNGEITDLQMKHEN